jgi:hypothetical protein
MKKNYFRMMFRCILASFTVLILASILKFPPILTMVAAIAPLLYYHFFFLAPQAKTGLSQTAIDSVYYFGFLITVAALGISAVSMANEGASASMSTIVYQFGIGLFATGYAVVARMHLSSMSIMIDEASPEAIMDRYVKRSVELVTNVEMACEQLASFSTSIMTRTAEVSESARVTVEKTMLDTARVFHDEMTSTLSAARDSLTTIRGLVNDTSFVVERNELAASMKLSVEATLSLNGALNDLAVRAREGANATQQISLSSADLEKSLGKFSGQVERFGGEDGVLAKSSESLQQSSQIITACNASIADAAIGLSDMVSIVADTGPTFKNMRTLTKKASEQLDSLADTSVRLDSAVGKMVEAAAASDSLAVGMSKVAAAMSPLTLGTEALTIRLTSAAEVSSRFEEQMAILPRHAKSLKDMGDEVADSLDQICEVIEDAVGHAKKLSEHTAESSSAIEAAGKLLTSAATLEITVASLQGLFGGLSTAVLATQRALSDSASEITTSIARSSEALEADVTKSSKAATLLTDRLIKVAQNIIDRTQNAEKIG